MGWLCVAGSPLLYVRWFALPSETCEPHVALVGTGHWSVNKVWCIKSLDFKDAFGLENLPQPQDIHTRQLLMGTWYLPGSGFALLLVGKKPNSLRS